MSNTIGRRTVVMGLGQAAAFGGLAAALSRAATAAQAAPAAQPAAAPMKVILTMLYPAGEGLTFDANRFRDGHIAVLKSAYGNSVERVELRVPVMPPAPPPPAEGQPAPPAPTAPPLLASVSIYLGNLRDFTTRAQAAAKTVATDMAAITKSAPIVQFDVIEGQAGEAKEAVIGGSTVISTYFFAKEGGTWDATYFGKTYMPKLMTAYGATALQRVEVSRGELAQGGGKPLIAGAIHLYVKDTAAFDAAMATEPVSALAAEAQAKSSINPVMMLMTVHASS
jgi:hypothetical protein